MIPQQLKNMFGLSSKSDLNMANNIWKMLDEMAQNSPQEYKNFIQKNIKQGVNDVKEKKQQKEKPFKIKPQIGFRVQFDMKLQQKTYINQERKFQEKLDIVKQKWEVIKKKFESKIKIGLNICFSNRIKLPKSVNNKQLQNLKIQEIKQIKIFYHSLNGPKQQKSGSSLDYIIVVNKNVFQSLMGQEKGKQMIISLAITHFQQRIQEDKNPLLKLYNPQLYQRYAFYSVQKYSIKISNKVYSYGQKESTQQILLQLESDSKRDNQKISGEKQQILNKKTQKIESLKKKQEKQKIITFKREEQDCSQSSYFSNEKVLPLPNEQSNLKKKPLIEVLSSNQSQQKKQTQNIPYSLTDKQDQVQIQFLIPGIKSIQELNLQIGGKCIKLNIVDSNKYCQIIFDKTLKEQTSVAKLKKKIGKLFLTVKY